MFTRLFWFVLGAIVAIGVGRWSAPDRYRPVYYPDPLNLTDYAPGPTFETADDARAWIRSEARRRHARAFDWEIGRNCRPFENSDIEVCKETLK